MKGTAEEYFTASARGEAEVTLFCLPFAGGGASAFRSWKQAFPSTVDLQPIQLPGRENRITEPLKIDPEEVADAMLSRINRPYAIYGHSMGARLGFDVIRVLRHRGAPMPKRFYVAASRPPDLFEPIARIADLPDDEFVARLENLGGTPSGVLDIPELRELLLPVLRADFHWIDNYRYQPGEPLPVPIVGFAGLSDGSVPAEKMRGWDDHTSEGFRLHTVAGDHFFLHSNADEVTRMIRQDLRESPARPQPGKHLVPLADTGWHTWQTALLRTTGFPASGLNRLADAELAATADAHLRGEADEAAYATAFTQAGERTSAHIWAIADDPLFREAVTWQNRTALHAVEGVRKQGAVAARNSKRRQREETIAQYWQRYCAKNETVGFFGPTSWITLQPQDSATNITAEPGPGLLRDRWVFFEHWALSAYGDKVTADPQARQWLAPTVSPELHLAGRQLLRPAQPAVTVTPAEAALLAACDGKRPAIEVAQAAVADSSSLLRSTPDALMLLGQLAERRIVRWDVDLPVLLTAEKVLQQRLTAIGDAALREQALSGLAQLQRARDRVSAAAGQPEELGAALAALDDVFRDLTGLEPQRRHGEMYAGRTLVVEECARDLDVTIGGEVIEAIAAPMGLLLQASRWLAAAAADAYLAILQEIYEELARDNATASVSFGQLWYLAQGLLFGETDRPIDAVTADFARRWSELFGLKHLPEGTRSVTFKSTDLAEGIASFFPATAPAWSAARIHSPDLHISAESVQALRRGDFSVVLGEMHAAWQALDVGGFLLSASNVEEMRAQLLEDLAPGRVIPLYPLTWPRLSARLADTLYNETDKQLGFMPAPGAEPDRLLRLAALTVDDADGYLKVRDGEQSWPIVEMFAELISIHTQGAFKLVEATGYTPRITVDRMVLARETWRTTVGATGLADAKGEQQQYLAARRWRESLGLPDRVFVSVATETKPSFVDLSSPALVSAFCAILRGARTAAGADVRVTVTEMLPTPEQTWVPDANGETYFSELRMHICDPEPVRYGGTGD